MKIISLVKNGDMASISLVGCPMKCGYCAHYHQPRKDITLDKAIAEMCSLTIKRVFIGGMDPAVQRKEVKPLIMALKSRGSDVALKTSGNDPDFLQETMNYVDRYVFEMKAPLDDVNEWSLLSGRDKEWTVAFLENMKKSLEIVRGKPVKIVTRVIPGHTTPARIEAIGKQLQPYAREAALTQFLGNLMNDYPYFGMSEPAPDHGVMLDLGDIMAKYIPLVRVSGSGFDSVVRH